MHLTDFVVFLRLVQLIFGYRMSIQKQQFHHLYLENPINRFVLQLKLHLSNLDQGINHIFFQAFFPFIRNDCQIVCFIKIRFLWIE